MTVHETRPVGGAKRVLTSVLAVVAGFLTIAVLSTATDMVLHVTGVFPPNGEPMFEPQLNALALAYRIVFTILGGYVTARLAPSSAGVYVLVLAGVGLVLGVLGVFASMSANLGPIWLPIALVVTAVPCVWFGGWLYRKERQPHGHEA